MPASLAQLLSPSVDIRAVIGSHLRPGDPFDPSEVTADNAAAAALDVVGLVGLPGRVPVVAGSIVTRPTPGFDEAGGYVEAAGARDMRVYTRLDLRLMFADLFAKLELNAAAKR